LVEAVRLRHFDELLAVLAATADASQPRPQRIAAFVDGMIAIHGRHPASHQVLLEDAPHGPASKVMHRQIEAAYRKCVGSLIAENRRRAGSDHQWIVVQVISAASAAVVHEAASKGTLKSEDFRREFLTLVDSYLSGPT